MKLKTISVFAFSLLVFAACNPGDSDNNANTDNPPQAQPQPQSPQIDPGTVNNPATANAPEVDPNDPNLPVLTFEKEIHEFPQPIKEGERVRYSFKFTNTGKSDLIITDAKAPCGCTIPSFSKEPIKPGGTGQIDVEYNSENRGGGRHEKSVTVMSNTVPNVRELRIVVNVIPKDQQ